MIHTRRALTLLVSVAFTAGTSGCSLSAPQAVTPASTMAAPPVADSGLDYREPGQVCEAFAAAVYRVDTLVDNGPDGAYRRAAAYTDSALAAAVADAPPVSQTPQWQQWTAHRVYVDVQVDPYAGDALPPEADGERHHAVVVTGWPIGRDGWRGPAQRHIVVCTLRVVGAGWRVSAYEVG